MNQLISLIYTTQSKCVKQSTFQQQQSGNKRDFKRFEKFKYFGRER